MSNWGLQGKVILHQTWSKSEFGENRDEARKVRAPKMKDEREGRKGRKRNTDIFQSPY